MTEQLDRLTELAQGYVRAGEEIIAVANVNYGGKVNLNQPPTGLAALGHPDEAVVAGEQLAERMGNHPEVTFPSANQMALVLTQKRLLCWSRGGFKAKPKAFIGEVPLEAVEEIGHEQARMGDRFSIKLRSGWEVNLESGPKDFGADFARQLRARVEAAAPPEPEADSGPLEPFP